MATLFNLTHPSPNLDEYNDVDVDGAAIQANAAAALAGTAYGLKIEIESGSVAAWGQKDFTFSANHFRMEVYFDPSLLTMASGDQFVMLRVLDTGSPASFLDVTLRFDGSNYEVGVTVYNDAAGTTSSGNYDIDPDEHRLEIHCERAAGAATNDGRVRIWLDGVYKETITAVLDNYDLFPTIDAIQVGPVSGLDTGTSGELRIDEIEANDTGDEIGEIIVVEAVVTREQQVIYKMRIYDISGTLVAEVTDFWELAYTKEVNTSGIARITLDGDHPLRSLIDHRYQVEIWRTLPVHEVDWYRDFSGFFMARRHAYTGGIKYFTLICPSDLIMLDWRYVMWKAGALNRSVFQNIAAETVLKTLVDYNAGANATAGNGRVRTGTITGLSVEVDSGGGNTIDWSCAWKPLLKELHDIARIAGGDFDLIKTGAATWEFRWYAGQRGIDRSSAVVFSLDHGNMADPVYEYDRIKDRTVCVAAGQGKEDARVTEIQWSSGYSSVNDYEIFADARRYKTTAGLQAAANEKLDSKMARREFKFNILQIPSSLYGKHYCVDGALGDLVTARYDNVEVTQKVVGVTISYAPGRAERIKIETKTQ